MRAVYLTIAFHKMRRVYAPPGSREHDEVRFALARLADDRVPLPGPDDQEALRTPVERIWARRVPKTDLSLTYSILPLIVEVRSLHPTW